MNKNKQQQKDDLLFIKWAQRERFVVFCRSIGFTGDNLTAIATQIKTFRKN